MSDEINISANETTIYDILSRSHHFEVPNYQRQYSWGENQWSDIWNDLINLKEGGDHFLGSIVVISSAYDPTKTNTLQLVDGQQRLTTIAVLLCCVRERYSELGDEESAEIIDNKFLWEAGFDDTKPRIKLGDLDQDDFLEILNGSPEKITRNTQLKNAYSYFYEKIDGMTKSRIDEIRELLLNKMSIVMIRSRSESSAFRLFETLNDRGMDLSAIDLMKNHLLRVAHEDSSTSVNEIKEEWEQVVLNVRGLSEPIRFFRHYIMSTPTPKIEGRVTESGVYDTFKNIISDITKSSSTNLEEYVNDMQIQSQTYMNIADAEVERFSPAKNSRLNEKLRQIDQVGGTAARTLLLRTFREVDSAEPLVQILDLIEDFMLRRSIARYTTGTDVDKLFNRLSHESFEIKDPVEHIRREFVKKSPSDEEFKRYFAEREHKQNIQTKYILDKLEQEYFTSGTGNGKEIGNRSKVHIEHIAPQRTFSAKKYSKWIDYLNVEEQTFLEQRNRIGNLTILEKTLNIEASDEPFEQKKQEYQESEFTMARELCQYDSWSLERINERSQELADVASEIWNLEH